MKKTVISVVATLAVLVILAQVGLLEYFGIHGISFGQWKKPDNEENTTVKNGEAYYDDQLNISYCVKAEGDSFYIYGDGNWNETFMAGVNIGATEPGLFPGELTISYDTYYRWFKYISDMNCNCIRIYTLMRPQFYKALYDYNSTADKPLYLYQGIWLNEEDISSLMDAYADNEKILTDFKADALQMVDVIHGKATVAESAGEASGKYMVDISSWMAGWIIGIEWDPNFVLNTDKLHPDRNTYSGKYLYTQSASAFEAFLCEVGDAMIEYETETYSFQIPLAFTNWITTDPLIHPNEPHIDEDKVSVNTENIKCNNYSAGLFASYHVYPYYPDSLNYQEDYLQYIDDEGKINTYRAYLEDLKLAHTMPIIVAEFGIPTSRGMGHESVMGYNQGGVDESEQGDMLVDMYNAIYDTDYAGGIVFTWQDEWFKRTWNNVMFDIADNRPFWSNIQTTEQNFGLLAFDPGKSNCVCYIDGDVSEWKSSSPIISTDQGNLYVKSDERYVYLMFESDNFDFNSDRLLIPINTISDQGNTYAAEYGAQFNEAADFLIVINGADDSHIYVDSYYDAFYYYFIKSGMLQDYSEEPHTDELNSGYFNPMRMCYGYHLTVKGTGKEYTDKVYETGKLRFGDGNPNDEQYTSLTDFCYQDGKLEVRIPWQLLNVMDPSTKQQIADFNKLQVISPVGYDHFDFGFGILKNDESIQINLSGAYTHDGWTMPTYHERLKPSYYKLQEYLAELMEKK